MSKTLSELCKPILAWVKRHQFKLLESQFKVQVQDKTDRIPWPRVSRKMQILFQQTFDIIWRAPVRKVVICFGHVLKIIQAIKLFRFILLEESSRQLQGANKLAFYCLWQVCLLVLFTVGLLNIDLFERYQGIDSLAY